MVRGKTAACVAYGAMLLWASGPSVSGLELSVYVIDARTALPISSMPVQVVYIGQAVDTHVAKAGDGAIVSIASLRSYLEEETGPDGKAVSQLAVPMPRGGTYPFGKGGLLGRVHPKRSAV